MRVVDFDPVRQSWYALVDLDEPYILAQDGLQPAEGDPRSHQQIVYAVASSVIERFERYLGRRFRWRGDEKLSLVPHAFEGRNAFFDPTRKAVLFGYYRADFKDPGANLPGQMIFTCLSSDIIAHEVTHAIVHRLRRHFAEATNPDVFAWHEAFADLIALFQHFAYRDVVFEAIASTSGNIQKGAALFDLASEFGQSTGRGEALRRAIDPDCPPDCYAHLIVSAPPPNLMNAVRASSVRCSTPTWIGIKPPSPTCCDSRRAVRAGCQAADCIPTWWLASPPKPSAPQTDSSAWWSAHSTTYRRLTSLRRRCPGIVTSDHSLYPTDRARAGATLSRRCAAAESTRRGHSLTDRALIWPSPEGTLSFSDGDPRVPLEELVLEASMNLDRASTPGDKPERVFSALNVGPETCLAIGLESTLPIIWTASTWPIGRPTTANPVPRSSCSSPNAARTSKNRATQPGARRAHSLAGRHHVDRAGGRRTPHIIAKPLR